MERVGGGSALQLVVLGKGDAIGAWSLMGDTDAWSQVLTLNKSRHVSRLTLNNSSHVALQQRLQQHVDTARVELGADRFLFGCVALSAVWRACDLQGHHTRARLRDLQVGVPGSALGLSARADRRGIQTLFSTDHRHPQQAPALATSATRIPDPECHSGGCCVVTRQRGAVLGACVLLSVAFEMQELGVD
eukprot:72484-Rhodomonas_salina.2